MNPRQDLADAVRWLHTHGLRCTDCDVELTPDMPRSVTEDDRVLCEDCYEAQDPRDPYLGPKPSVPVRKGTS